jgi:hypothetical protein
MRTTCYVLLASALTSSPGASQQGPDERTIRQLRASSNTSIARHDTAGVGAILAPTWSSSRRIRFAIGRATNLQRFADQFRTRPDVLYERAPDEVRIFEPWAMASERGHWTGSWTDTDGKIRIGGSYFAKWRR